MTKFIVFAVAVLATVCFCNAEDLFVINSMQDFLEFNELLIADKMDNSAVLQTDLDFSNTPFPLPLGVDEDGKCHFLNHGFDGGDHVIKNLKMDATNTVFGSAALFCGTHAWTIANLTIDSSCEFTGDVAAALAVTSTYNSFVNIKVYAKVTGVSVASAFVGTLRSYVPGFLPVGGFSNCKASTTVTLKRHNENGYIGGFMGFVNHTDFDVYAVSLTFEENEGDFAFISEAGDTDIGGLIGAIEKPTAIQLAMYSNTIRADTKTEKKFDTSVGGLIGRMHNVPRYELRTKDNSVTMTQDV